MAFKILNEEELSLLTDEQIACYQKELDIYKQREAFVEKLTKLENAEIKPYKPNLKSIDIIREIEFAPFISPEQKRLNMKPMQKPELPDDLIGKASEKINISEVIQTLFLKNKLVSIINCFQRLIILNVMSKSNMYYTNYQNLSYPIRPLLD